MIIFLYGEDTFRSLQKLKEIIARYQGLNKSGLNLKFFDFQEGKVSFQDFQDSFQTKSMFREKKLFVLKGCFSDPSFKEDFLKRKKGFLDSKNVVLIYEKRDFNKKDSFFSFLQKNATAQRFEPIKGKKLENWLGKELGKYGMKIEVDAKALLLNHTEDNLWLLSNEVLKLVNYKSEAGLINKEDVELMVRPKIQTNIFKTIDFIASKDKNRALSLIREHLEKGDSPLYILSMINFQFRNLLIMKEKILSRTPIWELKWHPFLIKKTAQLSKKFSLEELKKIYQQIFRMELDIKTGKIEPELALDLLIVNL